ncbi:hypothetical protein H261_17618 [Paramagnetospirillum caucaseum]|uniref:DUF3108 domain-containing protein n=1 Tax=Paramagnetospirillum caucaseum TaxID=1244869 RepID=M3A802_9PROT|nr:DUF3108 domain-containing protein [Paramagnetospirillum caucaseum]EME68594.1 hypothetical protein H261_17618 [Paramagnetospirillum caucaseum]
MMTRTAWTIAATITAGLGLAVPARAEPAGWRYEIMWGGFHAGEMALTREQRDETVRTGMTIRTVGLFDKILRLRFAAEGGGTEKGAGELGSEHYQTRFRNRYQEQMLRVVYGGGEAVTVLDEVLAVFSPPPEDDEPAPAVPADAKRGVRDPLTNVAMVGRKARQALAAGGPASFRVAGYDGRRAYDFDVAIKGAKRINIRGREFDAIEMTMVLRPVAGFKPRFHKMWAGAEYVVHLDPDSLLPLRVYTDSFAAATVINAIEPCRVAAEQCAPLLAAGE